MDSRWRRRPERRELLNPAPVQNLRGFPPSNVMETLETLPTDVLDLVLDRAGQGGRVRAGSSSTYLRDRVADFTIENPGSPPIASDIFLRIDAERVWVDRVCVARRLEIHWQSTGVKFHFGSSEGDTIQMFTLPVHGATGVSVLWRRVQDTDAFRHRRWVQGLSTLGPRRQSVEDDRRRRRRGGAHNKTMVPDGLGRSRGAEVFETPSVQVAPRVQGSRPSVPGTVTISLVALQLAPERIAALATVGSSPPCAAPNGLQRHICGRGPVATPAWQAAAHNSSPVHLLAQR